MIQLPAYLQNSRAPRLAERATEGLGSALSPHISIRGNRFTLVDQSGDERAVETTFLDVCIADMSPHTCKLFYGKDYAPDSNDPPMCFSANGIAPSKEAMSPQSATCQECQWNVRGSATSKLSGQPIKACRDEKWLAVLVVPGEKIIFQFRVTPGSFKNWKAYSEKFKGQPFDLKDVVTRLQFEKDANGVITFQPTQFIDEGTAKMREAAFESKAMDLIVGRLDQPIAMLPKPQAAVSVNLPAAGGFALSAAAPQGPPEQPTRRTRGRPKVEEAPTTNVPAIAPFRPAESLPNVTVAPFGIQANAPEPPNDIATSMQSFFKT